MGLGVRFDPGVVEAPVGVLGDLLDELVSALAKSAKRGEGDCLEVDVQALLLDDVVCLYLTKMNDVFADVCNAAGIEKTKRRGYYGWLREQYSYGHGQSTERAKRVSPPPTRFPLHFNDPFGKGKKSSKEFLAGVPFPTRR